MKTQMETACGVAMAFVVATATGCGGEIDDSSRSGSEPAGGPTLPPPEQPTGTTSQALEGVWFPSTVSSTGTPSYAARDLHLYVAPRACGAPRANDAFVDLLLVGSEHSFGAGRYAVGYTLTPMAFSATRAVLDATCAETSPPGGNVLSGESWVEVTRADDASIEGELWLVFGRDGSDRLRAHFRSTRCEATASNSCG